MAVIKPFKALRYSSSSVQDHGAVITPPYDVIDNSTQEELHRKSPYNVIRLEFGKTGLTDSKTDNRYSRAKNFLSNWLDEQILVPEETACYYFYEQDYTYMGKSYRRRGIFTSLKVEDYSKRIILPHELTMSAPKADRMELLSCLQTNVSPIFTLFPDPDDMMDHFFNALASLEPLIVANENSGQVHRIWALKDPVMQEQITAYLASQPLLIADGHHRYETALAYSRQQSESAETGKDYILAALVSMKDPGLLVLPTHRLVSELTQKQESAMQKIVDEKFEYVEFGIPQTMDKQDYLQKLSGLSLKNGLGLITAEKAGFIVPGKPETTARMPVNLLHEEILKPVLAPGEKSEVDKTMLSYPHDLDTAVEALLAGQAVAAFILQPIAVEEVLKRAEAGEVMPQKSTFFYPKLPSGLVMSHHKLSF
jgi:uncharacterized protein (DUF1015 family)